MHKQLGKESMNNSSVPLFTPVDLSQIYGAPQKSCTTS